MISRWARAGRVTSWLGLAGHLCTLPYYLASGLVAPLWAIIVLLLAWLGLLALALLAVRARSAWAIAVPVAAVALWWCAVTAGEIVLGWQA